MTMRSIALFAHPLQQRLPEEKVAALREPSPGDLGVIAGTYAALGECGRATALVSGQAAICPPCLQARREYARLQ